MTRAGCVVTRVARVLPWSWRAECDDVCSFPLRGAFYVAGDDAADHRRAAESREDALSIVRGRETDHIGPVSDVAP